MTYVVFEICFLEDCNYEDTSELTKKNSKNVPVFV